MRLNSLSCRMKVRAYYELKHYTFCYLIESFNRNNKVCFKNYQPIKIFDSFCRNTFKIIGIKTFYCKKNTQRCFLNDAISQIENDDPEMADIVMIGPPTGSEDSDMKSENKKIMDATGLPNNVAGEVEVFQITSNEVISDRLGRAR